VCQTLADEFRSFCNFRFMFPLRFLDFIAESLGVEVLSDGYTRQILTWRIELLLRDISQENFQDLRAYLAGENVALKRFQLARKLANIFDQYQVMRPEMLVKWAQGRTVTTNPAEKWQMQLWLKLTAEADCGEPRGLLFRRVIKRLSTSDNMQHLLPQRVSVLGLHIMPPVFLEFLKSLAIHCDIHLFILSPCKHYWGDLETKRMQLKHDLLVEHHPLLTSLGQQGRDFQKMMLENVDFEVEFASFQDSLEEAGSATLLHTLQSDLLHGEVVKRTKDFPASDSTVRVVSCHSSFREIAVLKDHLLQMLHDDHTLQLRDILVMAPDIQEYGSLIPAVFDDMQYSIADYSLKRKNNYINAFLSFLELFKGRYGWIEVMDLLRQPVVYPHFDLAPADLDILQQWVLQSGIRWGLSQGQREQMDIVAFPEASWSAGLERLLMGYSIDSEEFIDDILPFPDIEGSGAGILGGLCQFIEIIEGARTVFAGEHNLNDWSMILLDYFEQIFGIVDLKEYIELQNILAEPSTGFFLFHHEKVGFEVILGWLEMLVQESRSSGGFLRGHLTFCSMLPMRSVPFRVVCLLGLNDGVFPKNDISSTFDLLAEEFRPGDRSARADDRYQFLEAILAARSKLYLSYIGQSIRTNEAVPPSVVVTEFIELLTGSYGIENPVVLHPLHPFNSAYFIAEEDRRLFSYNDYFCKTAENLQKESSPQELWWQGEFTDKNDQISFHHLVSFYRNPQSWFVSNRLGLDLGSGQDLPEERELFEPGGGLEQYLLNQEIIARFPGRQEDDLLAELKAEGRWPLGKPGEIRYREKTEELSSFIDLVSSQKMGEKIADTVFELQIGRYNLTGTLANVYEHGVMLARYADLKGKDLLGGWLHHLVAQHLFGDISCVVVSSSSVISFSSEDTVPGLELMLDVFSAGCTSPSSFYVEPALIYCKQLASKRARIPPIVKSLDYLHKSLDNGYEPAWNLLLQGHGEGPILGAQFESQCLAIMNPIWEAGHGS